MKGNLTLVLLGILLVTGKGIIFGIEGSEPTLLAIPQVPIAGWALVALGFQGALPFDAIRAIKRKLTREKDVSLLERVKEVEGNAEECEETDS